MVISLEGDNFVEFYNLSVCEIWPDKRSGVYWEGLYKGDYCTTLRIIYVL
jgi:hypothetical protein